MIEDHRPEGKACEDGKALASPGETSPVVVPGSAWYALYVQVNHEKKVALQLSQKAVSHFLPLAERWSSRKDRRTRIHVPLFPGYIFIHTCLDYATHVEIVKIPGTVYILRNTEGPVPIPDHQIHSLRTILEQVKDLTVHPYLKEGQWVRVVRGPLEGCVGILVRRNPKKGRLVVSVDVIRRSVSVELDIEDVSPVDPPK
jgi:transcription antitermination factor NusG